MIKLGPGDNVEQQLLVRERAIEELDKLQKGKLTEEQKDNLRLLSDKKFKNNKTKEQAADRRRKRNGTNYYSILA